MIQPIYLRPTYSHGYLASMTRPLLLVVGYEPLQLDLVTLQFIAVGQSIGHQAQQDEQLSLHDDG